MIRPLTGSADAAEVIVVGSANADLVVTVDRRPAGGETVLGSDTVLSPGGKGANQAVAAAKAGAEVALLGAVGNDDHGQLLLDSLKAAGVCTDAVRTPDRPTGIAYITVTPDGENSIVVSPGANSAITPSDVDSVAAAIGTARVLLASMEIPLTAVIRAVETAAAAGVRPVLNLSPVAPLTAGVLAVLDPLVVNEHEAAWLLGDSAGSVAASPDKAAFGATLASRLLSLGPRSVVVTLGAVGAVVAEPGNVATVAAPKVHAVDTTGAGDGFAGALVARLAAGESLVAATRFAVRAAAVSVTKPGAQPSYPTQAEVDPS